MNDMSSVIVPKSDQINADDFIAGPQTITIREVQIRGGQEQPVSIYFEGSDKAFRPCKSMSRVLVQAWGPDAKLYVGRSLTLFRDPSVKWAGMEVGGIRISHMSHIDGKLMMQLTATKGQRKPHIVMPLIAEVRDIKPDAAQNWASAYTAKVAEAADADGLEVFVSEKAAKLAELEKKRPELHAQCVTAVEARRSELSMFAGGDDGFTEEPAPHDAYATDLTAKIDACTTTAALDELRAEYEVHAKALPGDLRTVLDGRFETMGRGLARREGEPT